MKKIIHFVDTVICKAEVFVLAWGIIIMAFNNVSNAVGRYFFSQSIYFSEELNSLIMVVITFFGLGYVTRKGRHIRMSAIYDLFPIRVQRVMMLMMSVVNMIIFGLLAYYAYEYVLKTYTRGRVTPALSLPVYITYIWIVVGFTTAAIQYALCFLKNLDFTQQSVFLSYTAEDVYEENQDEQLPSAALK